MEEKWTPLQVEFNENFDEQKFLEAYMTDYGHSDEIAMIDDIDCFRGENAADYDPSRFGWLEDYHPKFLQLERNGLMRVCLKEALKNYMDKLYPLA